MIKKHKKRKTFKKIKLVSTLKTGYFYVTKKSNKLKKKISKNKYDPIKKRHALFIEIKI